MEKYSNIINEPYNKSTKRKQMSLNDRAAQFAPFAALVGYDEALKEISTPIITKKKLNQENKGLISAKLNFIIINKLEEVITITYFVSKTKDSKAKYNTISKSIKRIDDVNKEITFIDRTKINIDDIIDIKSKTIDFIFNELD